MIKKLLGLATLIIIGFATSKAQTDIKVLFVGNSYTMPLQGSLDQVFSAKGDNIFADLSASGGQTLKNHDEMPMFEEALKRESFDYVVLQEQSQMPSFPPNQVKQEVYPYAKNLVDKIRKQDSCIEPVFYMTWGRENGDKANCPNYKPLCTYEGMQRRLRTSYMEMARANNATVSPVGMAWKAVRAADSNMKLYEPDESHPNQNGVYLTACVFYSVFTQKSALGASDQLGMDTATGHFLERMAAKIVLDSIPVWRIMANEANAGFDYTENGKSISFTAENSGFGKKQWYFGDGNSAFGESVNYNYTEEGEYVVSLVHTTACGKDSSSTIVNVSSTSISSTTAEQISIYPNPATTVLFIRAKDNFKKAEVFDNLGRKVMVPLQGNQLDISQLPIGYYVLKLDDGISTSTKSFIKK